MKKLINKNNIEIQYLNISELVDTTAFSEKSYFFVKYHENGKEVAYFVEEAEFENLVNGKYVKTQWNESLLLIKKDMINLIEKYGFYSMEYLYGLDNKNSKTNIKRQNMISLDVEKDLFNPKPEFELIKMIKNPNSKFAWMDLSGNIKCEPFIIDGSPKGELNNAKYHIDELAEHLSHREDIAFITHTGRWERDKSTLLKAPLSGKESSIGGIISEMEHHLEEGESAPAETEEMTIVYYPKKEEIQKLIGFDSQVEGRKPENQINRNYFVERYILNEILGAKNFLIEPPQEEIKVRKFRH